MREVECVIERESVCVCVIERVGESRKKGEICNYDLTKLTNYSWLPTTYC